MKQIFKHKTYRQKDMANNILKMYASAEVPHTGYNWYTEANEMAQQWARDYGLSTLQVSGIIASLSANTSWEENKKLALEFIQQGTCGHTRAMLDKATGCMFAETEQEALTILNGLKISNFFLNILHPKVHTGVTIDRHAVAVALGKVPEGRIEMTKKQYLFFTRAYEQAADVLGLLPHQLQAVTWVKWRVLKKEMA